MCAEESDASRVAGARPSRAQREGRPSVLWLACQAVVPAASVGHAPVWCADRWRASPGLGFHLRSDEEARTLDNASAPDAVSTAETSPLPPLPAATVIAAGVREVRAAVARAAARVGRDPAQVRLVAVSKGFPTAAIEMAAGAGVREFGENRVQEALSKRAALPSVEWHLIGQLQRNKCRQVVGRFRLIHAVDRADLAESLERAADQAGVIQEVLLQVSLSGRPGQGGVTPAAAGDLLRRLRTMPHLLPLGLMAIAPLTRDPEQTRPAFATVRVLRDRLRVQCDLPLPELSMGMSGDYGVAVEEGATIIRVGRAIFGERVVSEPPAGGGGPGHDRPGPPPG